MFKNLISNLNFTKFVIYLLGGMLIAIFSTYLNYSGRDLPNKQKLKYSEGKLLVEKNIYRSGRTASNSTRIDIALFTFNPTHETKFGCIYSYTNHFVGCKDITEFDNKTAKIGWYEQKPILGLRNNEPQIVTVTVDGKDIITYQDTLQTIALNNRLIYAQAVLFGLSIICLIKFMELLIAFLNKIFKK